MASVTPVNGSAMSIATTIGTAIVMSTISNVSSAVAGMATGHGLLVGDIVLVASGWSKLDGRVARISVVAGDNVTLEGINSSDVELYPAGTGGGTLRKITAWTTIGKVMTTQPSGGEPQYWDYKFQDGTSGRLPTGESPMSMAIQLADDLSAAGHLAIKSASESGAVAPIRFLFKGGGRLYCNGFWSFGKFPVLETDTGKRRNIGFAPQGDPTEYAS